MVTFLTYTTAEEAQRSLEKYDKDNREAFEGFIKSQGQDPYERLKRQKYFFVAELAAYTDDLPDRYYYESQHFPFLGFTESYDSLSSLVQGVKDAVRHQVPQNIEAILYTVTDHSSENQESKKNAEEGRKIAKEYQSHDGAYGDEFHDIPKEEVDGMLDSLADIEGAGIRGLTEAEREEFVKLYT